MPTRARLSQDRSRLRREELLGAAIALFAEGGARAITHRAVASRAGLPPATTTYYFTSIEELIDEAVSRHLGIWLQDLRALASAPVEADITLDDADGLISAVFAVRSTEVVSLQLAIYLAAARKSELRPKAGEALDALEILVAKVLGHLGVIGAESLARSVVAVITGSAIGRLTQRHTNDEETAMLLHSIRGLIAAALLGDDEVAAKLDTLQSAATVPTR